MFFFCAGLRCSECKVNISAQERSARCENSLRTGNALTLRDCITVEQYCIQTAEPNPAYEAAVVHFKHKFKWKNSGENPGRTYKYNRLSDF